MNYLNVTLHVSALNNTSHIHQVVADMTPSDQRRLDQMILDMIPRSDVKDSIQLLKWSCFRFRQSEPSEDEAEEIPCSVKAKSALRCKGLKKWRPRQC